MNTNKAHRHTWEQYFSVILLCAEDRGRAGGHLLQELNKYALKRDSIFPATFSESLVMINYYFALEKTPRLTNGYEGV